MGLLALVLAAVVVVLFLMLAPESWRKGMVENLVADIVVVAMAFAIFEVMHGLRERSRSQEDAEKRLGLVLREELLENAQWFKRVADQIHSGMIDPKELGEPKMDAWQRAVSAAELLADVPPETLDSIEQLYRFLATSAPAVREVLLKAKTFETSEQRAIATRTYAELELATLRLIAGRLHLQRTENAIQEMEREVWLRVRPYWEELMGRLSPESTP